MISVTILIPFPVSISICSSITSIGFLSCLMLCFTKSLLHGGLPYLKLLVSMLHKWLRFIVHECWPYLESLLFVLPNIYQRPSSKLLVFQKHDSATVGNSWIKSRCSLDLPDDGWVEVLCRLSPKSMVKCKLVSKSWSKLISDVCIPKIKAPSLHGLFFLSYFTCNEKLTFAWDFACIDDTAKNNRSSFLHSCFGNLPFLFDPKSLRHCSNGFLLIIDNLSNLLYVCNPLTEQCISLPKFPEGSKPNSASLMFDPHLKVVYILRRPLRMIIYSSSTREWRVHRGLHLEDSILTAKWTFRHVPLDGCLYCLSLSGHLLEFDVNRVTARAILLPKIVLQKSRFSAPLDCIGLSEGTLHYGWCNQDINQIKVWTLHDSKWLPKHTIAVQPFATIFKYGDMLASVGFHPTSDVLFLGHTKGIFSYHPDNKKLECLYEAESGTSIDCGQMLTFPFTWNMDTLEEPAGPLMKN